jgi:uncharacterized lipoprotein YbaY
VAAFATAWVRLEEVSRADAPARLVDEVRIDPRSEFSLRCVTVDPRARYVVRAQVLAPTGVVLLRSVQSYPVLTWGAPSSVSIAVSWV